jgi:hypothetical protein
VQILNKYTKLGLCICLIIKHQSEMNGKEFLIKLLTTLGVLSFRNEHLSNEAPCPIDSNYKYMSSKTSYELIANKNNFKEYTIRSCRQIGIWHLSRHGQRFPDMNDIIDMNNVLSRLKAMILNSSKICTWTNLIQFTHKKII